MCNKSSSNENLQFCFRKVCNWFQQHRRVKREIQQKQQLQRWQQWYQHQLGGDPNYYTPYINWWYQMYTWYTQHSAEHYSQNIHNQHEFKVPTSPVPKSRITQSHEVTESYLKRLKP